MMGPVDAARGKFVALHTQVMQGNPTRLIAVSGNWTGLGAASQNAATQVGQVGADTAAEHGEEYAAFEQRTQPTVAWLNTAAGIAQQIATGLEAAGRTGVQTQFTADELSTQVEQLYAQAQALAVASAAPGAGAAAAAALLAIAMQIEQCTAQLDAARAAWSAAYNALQPDAAPGTTATPAGGGAPAAGNGGGTAPMAAAGGGGGAGGGAGGGGGAGAFAPAGSAGGAAGAGGAGAFQPAEGVSPGAFGSSVAGPGAGEFEGWVTDPTTGYLVDPATGREFDPVTGRWIDPVTGQPFGQVGAFASRLEGIGGAAAFAPGVVGAAGIGGAGAFSAGAFSPVGFGAMYGGTMPPSLSSSNPAAPQLANQAMRHMDAKAFAASQLAARETGMGARGGAMGGFAPPMAGGAAANRRDRFSDRENQGNPTQYPGHRDERLAPTPDGMINPGAAAMIAPPLVAPMMVRPVEEKKSEPGDSIPLPESAFASSARAGSGLLD